MCGVPVPTATEEEEVGESLGGKSWSFEILRVRGREERGKEEKEREEEGREGRERERGDGSKKIHLPATVELLSTHK